MVPAAKERRHSYPSAAAIGAPSLQVDLLRCLAALLRTAQFFTREIVLHSALVALLLFGSFSPSRKLARRANQPNAWSFRRSEYFSGNCATGLAASAYLQRSACRWTVCRDDFR